MKIINWESPKKLDLRRNHIYKNINKKPNYTMTQKFHSMTNGLKSSKIT